MGARPITLKILADKWGTTEDYLEMMRLAGHPIPDQTTRPISSLTEDQVTRELLDCYSRLPPDVQDDLLQMIRALEKKHTQRANHPDTIKP